MFSYHVKDFKEGWVFFTQFSSYYYSMNLGVKNAMQVSSNFVISSLS